ETHAAGGRAPAQDHAVVIEGAGQPYGVLVLSDRRQTEDVGVVLSLPGQIRRLVAGMGDLADSDHARLSQELQMLQTLADERPGGGGMPFAQIRLLAQEMAETPAAPNVLPPQRRDTDRPPPNRTNASHPFIGC